VTFEDILFLGNFIPNPEKSHFHRLQTLSFDSVVHDAHRRDAFKRDGGFWLRVTHICDGESKNNPHLAIVVEGI
jgi:hypothetical protein